MSVETDRAAWNAAAFYTATCLPDSCSYIFSWEIRGPEGKSRREAMGYTTSTGDGDGDGEHPLVIVMVTVIIR